MGPAWCSSPPMLDTTCGPLLGEDVNLGRGERSIAWCRLHHVRDGQAVTSVFEERPGGAPSSCETRQVRGSLVSERTIAVASDDAWIPEQLIEHDGILLSAGIPSRSNDVVKSGMDLSIFSGCCAVATSLTWPHYALGSSARTRRAGPGVHDARE